MIDRRRAFGFSLRVFHLLEKICSFRFQLPSLVRMLISKCFLLHAQHIHQRCLFYKYLNSFASLYRNSCNFVGFWTFYERLKNSKIYKIHVIQRNIKNIESEAAVTISPKWSQSLHGLSLYLCYYITQIVILVEIWNFVKVYYNKFIKVSGCFPGGSV